MKEHRGRPKNNDEPITGKYTIVYKSEDGTEDTWYYNTDITTNGPVKVEIKYPKGYDFRTYEEKISIKNKKLPLTKRKYLHPSNGKLVGYTRARALGII